MNELKATPGPWRRDQYGAIMDANGEIVRLHGFALCCGYTEKGDPSFANTSLALASLEMYGALKRCLQMIAKECADGEYHDVYLSGVAAIKKARGE